MHAIRAVVIDPPMQDIHIKGHETAAGVVRRNHTLLAAQYFVTDPNGDPSNTIIAASVLLRLFTHSSIPGFPNINYYNIGQSGKRFTGNSTRYFSDSYGKKF